MYLIIIIAGIIALFLLLVIFSVDLGRRKN